MAISAENQELLTLPIEEDSFEPVDTAIVKVHSRCNLDCDYCYVYNLGDGSWRDQPRLMSEETLTAAAGRVGTHLQTHPRAKFSLVFHGGEPLLAPPEFFDTAARIFRQATPASTVLQFTVQTNGTRLNPAYLETFRRNSIRVGISLDGSREANDRHRLNHAGKSSYQDTLLGLKSMIEKAQYRKLFTGILAVVDIRNDPVEVYESLRELQPPAMDFLLPHGNWANPPYGLETAEARKATPYGNWYNAVFDTWYPKDARHIRINTFDAMLKTLRGGQSGLESIGGKPSNLVVIETNGDYELLDTLKSTPGEVTKTGLSVYENEIDEAAAFMAKRSRLMGATALAKSCQSCRIREQCGGGYLPHRYSSEAQFANRSVYCLDLARTIAHIYGRLHEGALYNTVSSGLDGE